MTDLHPTLGNQSSLKTSPAQVENTSAVYRRRPVNPGQLGRATSYVSNGESFTTTGKPHYYQLAAWDNARRKEPIIFDGLQKIVLAILMKLGSYTHPDPNIQEFVRENITTGLPKWIADAAYTTLWSGSSASETIWKYKTGPKSTTQVWIDELINYNPIQVNLRLNPNGRLTHGEKVPNSPYLTGVWVPVPAYLSNKPKPNNPSFMGSYIRLPKSKLFYTAIGTEGNNPFGTSLLSTVLEYHLFKEAFRDMLAVALDRYGTPLVYAVVPNQQTNQLITELDGSTRPQWLHEQVKEVLSDMRSEVALIFTQLDKDHPVKLDSLTTSNNFADTFTEAIKMCDSNMMIGMGIPNLIVRDDNQGLGSSGAAERQTELFHAYISALYRSIVGDFLDQVVLQLIQYNFDPRLNPLAYKPGTIKERPMRWSELSVLSSSIDKLTQLGYLSPNNDIDMDHVRDTFHLPLTNQ